MMVGEMPDLDPCAGRAVHLVSVFAHARAIALIGIGSTIGQRRELTQRERQVIDLISDGLSNKEIAQGLCIATSTVKGHVHSILEKLALRTRLQIAAYARNGYRATSAPPSSPVPPPAPSPPSVLRIERQSPPGRRRSIDG